MIKIFVFILLLFLQFSSLYASREIGIAGIQAWTDQKRLESPIGFGVFYYESLSDKIRLRFEYDKLIEANFYCGTWIKYAPPTEDAYFFDCFSGKIKIHAFELAAFYTLKKAKPLRLELGIGLNHVIIRSDITGRDTGFKIPYFSNSKFGISYIINFRSVPVYGSGNRAII